MTPISYRPPPAGHIFSQNRESGAPQTLVDIIDDQGLAASGEPTSQRMNPSPTSIETERSKQLVRGRDPATLAQVARSYAAQILRAARGGGFSAQEAEDLAQDTFTTFVETAPRFEGRSKIRTWLFGILYKKMAEARRSRARDSRNDPIDEMFEANFEDDGTWARRPKGPHSKLETKEVRRALVDCLNGVPDRQRAAFRLKEIDGMSTGEICSVLEVTRTNLGVMLHRVRNRLRECLQTKGVR